MHMQLEDVHRSHPTVFSPKRETRATAAYCLRYQEQWILISATTNCSTEEHVAEKLMFVY